MFDKIKEIPWGAVGKDVYNPNAQEVQNPSRRDFLVKAGVVAVGLIFLSQRDKFEKLFAGLETLTLSDSQKKLLGILKNIPPDQLDREYVLHDLTVAVDGANVRKSPYAPLDNKSGENAAVARLEKDVLVPKVVKVYGKSPDMPGAQSIWYAILDYENDQFKNVAFTHADNLVIPVAERPTAGNKKTITLNP